MGIGPLLALSGHRLVHGTWTRSSRARTWRPPIQEPTKFELVISLLRLPRRSASTCLYIFSNSPTR